MAYDSLNNTLITNTIEIVNEAYKKSSDRLDKEELLNRFYYNIRVMVKAQVEHIKANIKDDNKWKKDFLKLIEEGAK